MADVEPGAELVACVPPEWDEVRDILADGVRELGAVVKGSSGTAPYGSVTRFLLHFFHKLPPSMPDNKLQLMLLILHHPKFSLADVPRTLGQFLAMDKLIPAVPPGLPRRFRESRLLPPPLVLCRNN